MEWQRFTQEARSCLGSEIQSLAVLTPGDVGPPGRARLATEPAAHRGRDPAAITIGILVGRLPGSSDGQTACDDHVDGDGEPEALPANVGKRSESSMPSGVTQIVDKDSRGRRPTQFAQAFFEPLALVEGRRGAADVAGREYAHAAAPSRPAAPPQRPAWRRGPGHRGQQEAAAVHTGMVGRLNAGRRRRSMPWLYVEVGHREQAVRRQSATNRRDSDLVILGVTAKSAARRSAE